MADLPITQVGRIDALAFGRPSIRLTAQGVSVTSLGDRGRVGIAVVHDGTLNAFYCDFDFTKSIGNYPQRFLFGGPIVQT